MHRAGRLTAKVNGREETGSNPARSVLENAKEGCPLSPIRPKASERKPGAPDCPAAWPSVLRYAPSHAQGGQDGVPGFRAASGRLKRKSAVRQNGAI